MESPVGRPKLVRELPDHTVPSGCFGVGMTPSSWRCSNLLFGWLWAFSSRRLLRFFFFFLFAGMAPPFFAFPCLPLLLLPLFSPPAHRTAPRHAFGFGSSPPAHLTPKQTPLLPAYKLRPSSKPQFPFPSLSSPLSGRTWILSFLAAATPRCCSYFLLTTTTLLPPFKFEPSLLGIYHL